jgi:hypothetical protein
LISSELANRTKAKFGHASYGCAKPPLNPVRLDIRKVLTVATRRALVGAALGIGMRQNIVTAELVAQGVEPISGFRLRFRV